MAEGKPWEDFQEEDGPWKDYSQGQVEEGLISKNPTSKLSMLGAIGDVYESLLPAPIRQAAKTAKDTGSASEAGSAFLNQIGKDPATAPDWGMLGNLASDPTNVTMLGSAMKTAKAVKPLSKVAAEAANELTLKGAGAMKSTFKELGKKDLIQELGRFAREMGFVKGGDSVEDVAEKSAKHLKQTGDKLGELYGKIKDKFSGNDLVTRVLGDVKANFGAAGKVSDNPMMEQRAQEILMAELEPLMGKDLSAKQLHNIRKDLDAKIKWSKTAQEMPEKQKALLNARNSINQILEELAEKVADKGELKKLNQEYSKTSRVAGMSADRVAANQTNRAFSLTDYMTGLGAGGSYLMSHPDQILKSAGLGLGAAALNRTARKIGPGGVASMLSKMEKPLSYIDPATTLLRQRPGMALMTPLKVGQGEAAAKRRLKALK